MEYAGIEQLLSLKGNWAAKGSVGRASGRGSRQGFVRFHGQEQRDELQWI